MLSSSPTFGGAPPQAASPRVAAVLAPAPHKQVPEAAQVTATRRSLSATLWALFRGWEGRSPSSAAADGSQTAQRLTLLAAATAERAREVSHARNPFLSLAAHQGLPASLVRIPEMQTCVLEPRCGPPGGVAGR